MGWMDAVKFLADKGSYLAGRVYRYVVRRPVQRYNVENRTYRLLDKYESGAKTPTPAPLPSKTQEFMKRIQQEHPEVMKEIKEKPQEHLEHLNRVKVVVDKAGINAKDAFEKTKSKLPTLTRAPREPAYGVRMPDQVPPGKMTLDLYVRVCDERYYNPDIWTNKYVGDQFSIQEDHVRMVTEHFKPFKVYKYEHEHVPWHSPRKMEMLIVGTVTPNTWQHYFEEEQRKIEAAEKHQEEMQKQLEQGRRERFLAWQEEQNQIAAEKDPKLINEDSSEAIKQVESSRGTTVETNSEPSDKSKPIS